MDAPMMVTRRDCLAHTRKKRKYFWCSRRDSRRDINGCSRPQLGQLIEKSVILILRKYNFWSLASHKIITNGSYKKDSGLQCPLSTYQKMQLCLTLLKNTENRRNLAMFSIINAGILKTMIKRMQWQIIKFVTNHFHRVLVVIRPVKPLFDFPKSIIATGVSRKRSSGILRRPSLSLPRW